MAKIPTYSENTAPADDDLLISVDISDPTDDTTGTSKRLQVSKLRDIVEDTTPQLGGNLDANGFTIDGRTVATDGTKLDGIEALADVTDTANVTSAGALMDSECTSLADVKALDQSVVSGAAPTFAGTNLTGTAASLTAGTVSTITGLAPDTATTQATQAAITTAANLTTTGALNAGSITSGFGTIDNGASDITTTGDITGGGIHATGDSAAGDNSTLAYSSTEGAIIAGQGSVADFTLKNDADTNVLQLLTGTSEIDITGTVDIIHTAANDDDHALELEVDAAGFGGVKCIDIDFITGAISTGEEEATILSNIDQIAATGGTIVGHAVLATDGSADAIFGQKSGAGVGPILQASGSFSNPTTGTNNTTATNVPAMTDGSTGTNTTIFVADNDYIIIGAAAAFTEIEFVLQTGVANPGVTPEFWYSTSGTHQFTQFSPIDGTNGFRNTGIVAWDPADLSGHVADDVTTTFDIKITRTHNSRGSASLYYAKTAATTSYSWADDGAISALSYAGAGTGLTGTAASLTAGTATKADALSTSGASVDVSAAAPPTTGQVLKATSATTATWQADADSGGAPEGTAVLSTGIGAGLVLTAVGDNSSSWQSAGAGDMLLASAQQNTGAKTFDDGTMLLDNVAGTFTAAFTNTNTADRVYTLQDAAGTVAFTSDITGTNSGTNTGDEVAATTTTAGIAEIATTAEVNTGTDDTRTISPLALAGSAPAILGTNVTAIPVANMAALTASELMVTDGSGKATTSTGVSATEAAHLNGVTSAIQGQIDGKQASDADLTALSSCQTGAATALALLTATEVAILDGATASTTEVNLLTGKTLSGNDATLITGTKGTNGNLVQWDVFGDAVDAGVATGNLYQVSGTDVAVTDGGTGRSTSTTAYGVICAGTTATGAQQTTATAGTSGQVLTSTGASSLPTWQDSTGGGGATVETSIYIDAAAMLPDNTVPPATGAITGTNTDVDVLDFDAATDEIAFFKWSPPPQWDGGQISLEFIWSSAETSGNVVWTASALSISDDEGYDATAFPTATSVTSAANATASDLVIDETAAFSIGSTPTVGDLILFKITRDADNGSDTKANDARLFGVRVKYQNTALEQTIAIACSDETTDLATGTAAATFRMPYAFTLTDIRASVTTAPTGSTIIADVNDGGTSIMTTDKLSIDVSEKTTETAATAPALTDTALADDAEITIDIDQVGSTITGAGLKVYLIGYRS